MRGKKKILVLLILFFSFFFLLFALRCFLGSFQLKAEAEDKDYSLQVEKMKEEKWELEEEGEFTLYKPSVEFPSEKIKHDLHDALNFTQEKFGESLPHFEVFCLTSNLKRKYFFSEKESFLLFEKGFAVECKDSNLEEEFLRAFFEYFFSRKTGKAPLWVREGLVGFFLGEEGKPYMSLEKVLSLPRGNWENLSFREKEEFLKTSTYILRKVEEGRDDGLGFFCAALKAGMSGEEALEYVMGKRIKILEESWGLKKERSTQGKVQTGKKFVLYTYIVMTVGSLVSALVLFRLGFA